MTISSHVLHSCSWYSLATFRMDDVFTVVSPGDDTTQEYCPPSDVWRGENGHWSV